MSRYIVINDTARSSCILVRKNDEWQEEHVSKDRDNSFHDSIDRDGKMSVDKLDDVVAALTLTATVITITLGFLFNL